MIKHYYRTLGLAPGASHDEIKTAYRTKAKKYHPDTSGTPASKHQFLEVHRAYAFLINRNPQDVLIQVQQNELLKNHSARSSDPTTYKQWRREQHIYRTTKPRSQNYLNYQKRLDTFVLIMRWLMFGILGFSIVAGVFALMTGIEFSDDTTVYVAMGLNLIFIMLYVIGVSLKYNPKKKY